MFQSGRDKDGETESQTQIKDGDRDKDKDTETKADKDTETKADKETQDLEQESEKEKRDNTVHRLNISTVFIIFGGTGFQINGYIIEYVLNPVFFRCSWSLRRVNTRHQYHGQYSWNHLPVPPAVQRYCVSVRAYPWQGKYKF